MAILVLARFYDFCHFSINLLFNCVQAEELRFIQNNYNHINSILAEYELICLIKGMLSAEGGVFVKSYFLEDFF